MKNKGFVVFCLKAIILLALVVIVDKAVGYGFVKMKDVGLKTNPECMWLKTPFVIEKVDADILIVGSSRAIHHYIPSMIEDSLDVSAYNCGQDGCFFMYQNYLINIVLDRYRPKAIIWDIQPECVNALDNLSEYQNVRYLSPYYGNNEWVTRFVNGEAGTSKYKMKSQMYAYNSKLLNSVFPLLVKGSSTEKGYIPLPSEGYEYPKLDSDFVDKSRYEGDCDKLTLFESTVERCKKEGVKLLIIASPRYTKVIRSYRASVSDLRNIASKYDNEVYDYCDYYFNNPTKFKDFGHLNHNGAVDFTELVINEYLKNDK